VAVGSAASGATLLARALAAQGVDVVFHLTGAPNISLTQECEAAGMRLVAVRHEQAAAAAAQAYARVRGRPGVCLAPAGPAVANLLPGVAHALAEQVPLVALGGSAPLARRGAGGFQEMDQVALMGPAAKRVLQARSPAELPGLAARAFAAAWQGRPGPVYLDLPADVLHGRAEGVPPAIPDAIAPAPPGDVDPAAARRALDLLAAAERPLVLAGSGVLWSGAAAALRAFVDASGIPFYTTPQARGAVAEDHPRSFPSARSAAFREADVVLAVGTRANFIVGHFRPPRWSAALRLVVVNRDLDEIARYPARDVALAADAKAALLALAEAARGRFDAERTTPWVRHLARRAREREERMRPLLESDAVPIHPMRLLGEVREILDRDAVVVEDGHDTLGFCRHTLRSFVPGRRINPGTMGNVGVGLPFALGARAALPESQVVLVSGDSAFGWNGMEIGTCCLHELPVLVVVCNNAGITARSRKGPLMPGQHLGHVDYQKVAEAFGGFGVRVEKPGEIRPALEAALASGRPALVNAIVDPHVASATHMGFAGVMGEG
jgi:thiamine pyrophosphate-dependent acetolactate synthase large subunit-like protein